MRVADKMNSSQVVYNLNKNRNLLAKYQNQAAVQKSITKPSDDPIGSAKILQTRTDIAGLDQYERNVLEVKSFVEFSEQSLSEASELVIRAKELAIQQANDASAGPETRKMVATEIAHIRDQMVNIANRRFGDRYLFGGYKTLKAPFDLRGNYYGDDAEIEVPIDKNSKMIMNIPGSAVFLGKRINDPIESTREVSESLKEDPPVPDPLMRDPAAYPSALITDPTVNQAGYWGPDSVNLFDSMRVLEIGLRTDDITAIQNSLDFLDESLTQVNMARADLGSRLSVLETGLATIQKLNVDSQVLESEIEDVDMFELVNNLSKVQNQLDASLATSGKLIQSTLLDFLR